MQYLVAVYFWVLGPIFTFALYFWIGLNQWQMRLTGQKLDGRRHHRVAIFWGKTVVKMMPGWHVIVDGKENIPEDRDAVVIVANHESAADVWALFFLETQFRWLAKAEIKKLPMIGRVMSWVGYIFVKRGHKSSAANAMKKSMEVIRSGTSMIFFPEGTRSENGILKPFKLGAFKLSQDTQVDILPVAIHGAGVMFPKGRGIPNPSTVKLKVLPRIKPPALGDDLQTYANSVREIIIEAHKELI